MTMYAIEAQRFGLAKESARGDAEAAPEKWYPTRGKPDINYGLQHLEDEGIRGSFSPYAPAAGLKVGEATIPLYGDAQMIGEALNSCMGAVSSAEESTIAIVTGNKYLDFDIGASALLATVAEATYPIGVVQTDTGSLCEAIFDALVAAEAVSVYTVTYSRTTNLITITTNAATFNILWKTGVHGSDNADDHIGTIIGYDDTADDGSAQSYAADNTIAFAMKHTFTLGTAVQKQAYTLFLDRSIGVSKYNLGICQKIDFKSSVDGLMEVDLSWLFKAEASGSIGSPSFPVQKYLGFQHVDFKVASASDDAVKEWNVTLNNQAVPLRTLTQSQDAGDIITAAKFMVEGGFTIYFESTTERDKFIANTGVALQMIVAGDTINGAIKYTIDINIYNVHYKAYPYGEDQGLLAAQVTFQGYYSTGDSKQIQIDVTNADASY